MSSKKKPKGRTAHHININLRITLAERRHWSSKNTSPEPQSGLPLTPTQDSKVVKHILGGDRHHKRKNPSKCLRALGEIQLQLTTPIQSHYHNPRQLLFLRAFTRGTARNLPLMAMDTDECRRI